MKVLITGSTGLIGGRLAEALISSGYETLLANRRTVETPVSLQKAKTVILDWNDSFAIERLCENCDVVIHTAGMNASDCAKDPVEALRFNGVQTTKLVQAAVSASVKKFFYLSTAHVYSDQLRGVISEETCPRNLHPYATSHRAAEDSILFASSKSGLEGIVLRLSNIVASPLTKDVNCWSLIVNDICRQVVTTQKIVLNTDGSQTRDFLAISELNLILQYLIKRTTPLPYRTINVGSGESTSILAIAQIVQSRCQSVLGFLPDITHLSNEGTNPGVPLSYQTMALDSLGYIRTESLINEVDNLLRFCSLEFGI